MHVGMQDRVFKFHLKCKRIGLSRLIFVADLLSFTKGDSSAVSQVSEILGRFGDCSGLKANMNKSCIQFGGVDEQTQQEICDSTRFVQVRCLSDT